MSSALALSVLHNLDKRTNELAEQTTGSRHNAACFTQLRPFEAVLFNKAAKATRRRTRIDLCQEAELYSHEEVTRMQRAVGGIRNSLPLQRLSHLLARSAPWQDLLCRTSFAPGTARTVKVT